MLNWTNIEFAEGMIYKLHLQDIPLFANTGIWELLKITTNLEIMNTYIPRYVYTFKIFMHCLRGYEVDVYYISGICKSKNIYIKHMIKMLIADNQLYKIKKMYDVLENLSYNICPNTLSDEQLERIYKQKSPGYQSESTLLYKQICELLDEPPLVPIYAPYKRLKKYYKQISDEKRFEEFKAEVNVKLPYMLMTVVKIIAESTDRPISPTFENDIKNRVRNDPDLAKELYQKLNEANILNLVSVCLSCLSAFIE